MGARNVFQVDIGRTHRTRLVPIALLMLPALAGCATSAVTANDQAFSASCPLGTTNLSTIRQCILNEGNLYGKDALSNIDYSNSWQTV